MFETHYIFTLVFGLIDFAFFSVYAIMYIFQEPCKWGYIDRITHFMTALHVIQIVLTGHIVYKLTPIFIQRFKEEEDGDEEDGKNPYIPFHYSACWMVVPLALTFNHVLISILCAVYVPNDNSSVSCIFDTIGLNTVFAFMSLMLFLWIIGPIQWMDKLRMANIIVDKKGVINGCCRGGDGTYELVKNGQEESSSEDDLDSFD